MIISSNNKLNSNSPIGFVDSGVGGLTVLDNVRKILPNENFLYYGDTIHTPYGDKTKEQLLEYSDNIFKFFEEQGCKAVVMACNTTSSTIYDDIKNKYNFEIYPIVQSAAKILSELPIERLGIFATRGTILSGAYPREIAKYNTKMEVFGQYCPDWVYIIENGLIYNDESIKIVENDLKTMLKNNPEKIVLGCTHYPFLTDILSRFAPRELFIDPAIEFAKFIKSDLLAKGLLNNNKTSGTGKFYVSANPLKFKNSAKMFYEIEELPELLTFQNSSETILVS